jgi:hypothetical protein
MDLSDLLDIRDGGHQALLQDHHHDWRRDWNTRHRKRF